MLCRHLTLTTATHKFPSEDITRVLTTILVMSTACSIYATTLFTHLADHILGKYAERWSAVFLTAATLFFVELLPKNIGVINAEKVGESENEKGAGGRAKGGCLRCYT